MLAYTAETYRYKILRILHYLYLIPLVLLTFKEVYFLIRPLRPNDYDQLLIDIDRWLFGTDPTVFLHQFSHPVITEILQIVYGMFYFLPIILGIALLRKRKIVETDFAIFTVIYGFFLSYLGYFALPAIGPRFTLHDFQNENIEMPGLLITNFLRDVTNTVESIPPGTPNPESIVQRDVFPSGHTMITLVVIYLSIKLKSRSRFFLVPVGSMLVFATVYLRYHYVIDLIGGLAFMIFCVVTAPIIFNWWSRLSGREEIRFKD
jgi:membrane-associated phospholipid phosphatase